MAVMIQPVSIVLFHSAVNYPNTGFFEKYRIKG